MSSLTPSRSGDAGDRRGSTFYDDPECFDRYQRHRAWSLSPNAVMEGPAFFEELGPVAGLRVLDLGCGDAQVGRELLHAGVTRYLGIDGSEMMVDAARRMLAGTAGEVLRCGIEDLAEPEGSFEAVLSRMALHYIADLGAVLRVCYRCLVPGGRIVLTVVHPVITSHDARDSHTAPRQSWVVDDYFLAGPREQQWLGARTVWYHRTVEDYVSALLGAGFTLSGLRECAPRRERFDDDAEFQRRLRIPLVLLLAGARPG
ncbi:MAG TPA: methyltransferase domain-containing protein [Solirubrobacteraceae bacterium]|jgi:SAM-dependent methyltransferase|nr:methyltransferase domain-containing protein [Solirubrobacteraceae bacterium]